MKTRWQETTLEDVCTLITDGAHNSPPSVDSGFPMASVKDLTPHGINIQSCRLIGEDDYQRLVRQQCQPLVGDVLIAKDGNSALDTVCEIRTSLELVLLSSVAILRPNPTRITSSFLRYYLACDSTRKYLKGGFITGAAIPRVIVKDFKRAKIAVPPLPIQRKIAGVLSAYDDLIENNTRRIAILEEMAQAIYREWFVNFRFPGHEKVKLINSPLGEIPEGWKIVSLKQITTKIGSGATPRGGKEAYKPSGISLIRSLNIYDNQFEHKDLAFIDDEQAADLDNVTIAKRDILLNITGASVARCCMVPSYLLPARVNQHVAIIRVDTAHADPFFVVNTINSERHKRQILALAQGGATREALTKDTISNYEIVLPTRDVYTRYGAIVADLFDQREVLQKKNNCLRTTRDLLLPKLISGQLGVEELDIDAGEPLVEATP